MKKLTDGINIFFRGFKTMWHFSPACTTITFRMIIERLMPFVNIYFSSLIIHELSSDRNRESLIKYIVIAVLLNFVCVFLLQAIDTTTLKAYSILWTEEFNSVTKIALSLDFEALESTEIQNKISLLKAHQENVDSPLADPLYSVSCLLSGLLGLGTSVYLLRPFIAILFQKTGEGIWHSPWLSVVVIATVIIAVGAVLLVSMITNKKLTKLNKKYYKVNRMFQYYIEMLSNYPIGKGIRIFREQELIIEHATDEVMGKGITLQREIAATQSFSSALLAIVSAIVGCGVYVLIAAKGMLGLFDVGLVVLYSGAFFQGVVSLLRIADVAGRLPRIITGLHYYFNVVDIQPTHQHGQENVIGLEDAPFSFRDVSFRYSGAEKDAISNINLTLHPGEKLAIVGENGSGKTTFIKLLCQLYKPQQGHILLGSKDIWNFAPEEYRKLFGVVFQDFKLFSLPLDENISVSNEIDECHVMQCLEEAGFLARLEKLPDGIRTILYRDIDDSGVEISGGEAQKIALARALYKNSSVLVLDEPSAALDPIAEYKLYKNFNTFAEDKTAIYISHRLSSCRFCDRIAVFHEGQIVQLGTHDELVQDKDGQYYALWDAQAKYYVNVE